MNGLDKIVLVEVFSSIGGGRKAFDLAALHVTCYIALDTSRCAAAVIESCWPDAHQVDHVKGSVSQIADCIRMHACCAARVLVIFGATHRCSSGECQRHCVAARACPVSTRYGSSCTVREIST
jgi:site-specific DNA-cytosine methylase